MMALSIRLDLSLADLRARARPLPGPRSAARALATAKASDEMPRPEAVQPAMMEREALRDAGTGSEPGREGGLPTLRPAQRCFDTGEAGQPTPALLESPGPLGMRRKRNCHPTRLAACEACHRLSGSSWCRVRDSNPRPPDYKSWRVRCQGLPSITNTSSRALTMQSSFCIMSTCVAKPCHNLRLQMSPQRVRLRVTCHAADRRDGRVTLLRGWSEGRHVL